MNTTLVLFLEGVTEIQQALRKDALREDNPDRFVKLELLPESSLPYEHEAYFRVITSRASQPAFARFVNGYFYDERFEHANRYRSRA